MTTPAGQAFVAAAPDNGAAAVKAVQTAYADIKFRTMSHEQGEAAVDLIKSADFRTGDLKQPQATADIALALLETVPADDRSRVYAAITTRPTAQTLHGVYPQLAGWYDKMYDHTLEHGKHPDRTEWQNVRQKLKTTIGREDLGDDERTSAVCNAIAQPVLARIGADCAFSELDVRNASASMVPPAHRNAFYQHHVFGSQAFATVQQECPVAARFFRDDAARHGYPLAAAAAPVATAPAPGSAPA